MRCKLFSDRCGARGDRNSCNVRKIPAMFQIMVPKPHALAYSVQQQVASALVILPKDVLLKIQGERADNGHALLLST